jgi:hypothetical protein
LVPDLQRTGREVRHRNGQDFVQGARAQASADHEQPQGSAARGQPMFGRRKSGDFRTYRIAHVRDTLACTEGAGESGQHAIGEIGKHAVGETGNRIGLVNDQRPAQQPRDQPARTGHEAAHAEQRIRPPTQYDTHRLPHGGQHHERHARHAPQTLAAQRANRDPFDVEAGRGHHARLQAVACAEPDDVHAEFAQAARHRECGKNVPAGTAGHDQQQAHARSPGSRRRLRYTDCNRPMAMPLAIRLLPP